VIQIDIYTYADTEHLRAAFNGRAEVKSRYVPQFPIEAEAAYRRFLERLEAGELYDTDIDRELAAIALLIINFTLAEWNKEVYQTLGIDLDLAYYRTQLENSVFTWVRQEADRIRRHMIEQELDPPEVLEEYVGLPALAPGGTGDLFAACMIALAAYSFSQRYIWHTEKDPVVRPYHAVLEGTVQYWDSPPVVNAQGDRLNPSEDWNCRCHAQMIFTNPFF